MNKKGFTLIELLAVIVILAIIALIAVPIVLGIIDNTKESSILRSGEFFVDAMEKSIMKESMNTGNSLDFNECALISENKVKCDGKEIPIEINGELPSKGSVVNFKEGKVDRAILYYDNKIVIKNPDSEFFIGDINDISGAHIALLESQIKDAYGKDIKLGDYVNYDETKGGTVTVGKNVKWRVLGIENGNLLLVSDQNIATNESNDLVTIYGYTDNSEEKWFNKINEPTKAYGNGNYIVENSVRSIKIEDINKITGYNPNRVLKNDAYDVYHKGRITEYGSAVTYTYGTNSSGNRIINYKTTAYKTNIGDLNSSFEYLEPKEFLLLDGTKLGTEDNIETKTKKSITIKNNYYWYNPEVLTSLDPNDAADVEDYNKAPKIGLKKETQVYDMLFTNTDKHIKSYWLSDTFYFTTSSIWHGMRSVADGKVGLGANVWYMKEYRPDLGKNFEHSDNIPHGVRAVVALKSDVKLAKANENTWNIQ